MRIFDKLFVYVFLFMAVFTFVSCGSEEEKSEDPVPDLEVVLIKDLAAPNDVIDRETGQVVEERPFVYFNLAKGEVVSEDETWDIAIKGLAIRVNGGTSGEGDAAAAVVSGIFEELMEVPAGTEFAQDNAPNLAIPMGSGNGWYSYNPQSHIVSPIAGRIILVRTHEGKFTKLEILSYYKGAPAEPDAFRDQSATYTFRYVHQPNGSERF
ncbi:MAG: HmuY family protein [Bernardetiaceae bacterium]|nr:HmuY family protein [Bernardetiaceae bacterium]